MSDGGRAGDQVGRRHGKKRWKDESIYIMKLPSPRRVVWGRTEILASHSSFRRGYEVYNIIE